MEKYVVKGMEQNSTVFVVSWGIPRCNVQKIITLLLKTQHEPAKADLSEQLQGNHTGTYTAGTLNVMHISLGLYNIVQWFVHVSAL